MNEKLADLLTRRMGVSFAIVIVLLASMMLAIKPITINGKLEGFYIENNPYSISQHKIEEFYPYKNLVHLQLTPKSCRLEELMNGLEILDSLLTTEFTYSKIHSLHAAKTFIYNEYAKDDSVFKILQEINKIPLLQQLVSDNNQHLLMIFYLKNEEDFNLQKFNAIVGRSYPGIERIMALSQFHIEDQIEKSLKSDLIKISIIILFFIAIFISLVYKNLGSVIVVLINATFSLLPLFFLLGLLNIEINMITVTAIPLILIMSLSNSVHLLTGFNHLYYIKDKMARIRMTITRFIVPSFLTSFTTSIVFFSFLFSDSAYIREFGIVGGIVVMVEFFITFLTVPFLMGFLRKNKFKNDLLTFISSKTAFIQKPGSVVLIGILISSVFFIGKLNFQTDYDSFFPLNTKLKDNYNEFRENFQSFIGLDIIIEKKVNPVSEIGINQLSLNLVKELLALPEIKRINSYKDQLEFRQKYLKNLPLVRFDRSDNIYVLDDKSRIHISVYNPVDIKLIKSKFEYMSSPYASNFEFSYFSPALLFDYINESVSKSLFKSLMFSGCIIFFIFAVLAGNLRNSFASILANLVPIGALILLFALLDIKINIGTSITAVVCLGFIVNDTIHILYRKIRLRECLGELSISLLVTSVLLAGGFLVFIPSNFQPTRIFGTSSALIFVIAFLSDILILNWLLKTKEKSQS